MDAIRDAVLQTGVLPRAISLLLVTYVPCSCVINETGRSVEVCVACEPTILARTTGRNAELHRIRMFGSYVAGMRALVADRTRHLCCGHPMTMKNYLLWPNADWFCVRCFCFPDGKRRKTWAPLNNAGLY